MAHWVRWRRWWRVLSCVSKNVLNNVSKDVLKNVSDCVSENVSKN